MFHALLTNYPAAEIWAAFGTSKKYTYLHINAVCHTLGIEKSMTLPLLHSCNGCDTSQHSVVSERSRNGMPGIPTRRSPSANGRTSPYFTDLGCPTLSTPGGHQSSSVAGQEIWRMSMMHVELFCIKNKSMENIPPTHSGYLTPTLIVSCLPGWHLDDE